MLTLADIINGHQGKVAVPHGSQFKVYRVNITRALEPEELGDWIYFEPFEFTDHVQGVSEDAIGEAVCDLHIYRGGLGDIIVCRADGEGSDCLGDEAVSQGLIAVN